MSNSAVLVCRGNNVKLQTDADVSKYAGSKVSTNEAALEQADVIIC